MKTVRVTSPQPPQPSTNELFSATFVFSLIVHGILILGITFAITKPKPHLPSLNVTLVNTANMEAPKHADFLAQANNSGGGNSDKVRLPSQPVSGLTRTPSDGIAPRPLAPSAPAPSKASGPHRITTTGASNFTVSSQRDQRQHNAAPRQRSPADIKRQLEMARLAAEINSASQAYARRPRTKYISASTRQYVYAAYMDAWAEKVERVGTINFPAAARSRQLNGNIILTVGIDRNGAIHSIKVVHSSGRKVLDDAAMRIVRMAAPFAPIPETGKPVDILYITRTYQFLHGGKLRTH